MSGDAGHPECNPQRVEASLESLTPGPATPLSQVLQDATTIAAEAMQVERVGIWLFADGGRLLRCADLYERSRHEHSEGATLRVADFPAYFLALDRLRSIPAALAPVDPRTAELAAAYLIPLGITSMLDAPIYHEGNLLGVICHEHTGPSREWSEADRNLASRVAGIISRKLRGDQSWVPIVRIASPDRDPESHHLDTLGQLAAGVAHDFKNLLTVILGSVGILQQMTGLPPGSTQYLNQIIDAAHRGERLTRELTDCARHTQQATTAVRIRAGVSRLIPLLEGAAGTKHPIIFRAEAGAGRVFIDPSHLERILLNLIINGRDATPEGSPLQVTVRPSIRADRADRVYAEIAVHDCGPGIDPAVVDSIFDPFFTTKPRGQGTGLGLATVRQMVDRAGGFITVESTHESGTTFRIFLPRIGGGD